MLEGIREGFEWCTRWTVDIYNDSGECRNGTKDGTACSVVVATNVGYYYVFMDVE